MKNLYINIDRIVISDADAQLQPAQLKQAIAAEVRLEGTGSVADRSARIDHIDGGRAETSDRSALAQHIAAQVAKGVQP